MKKLLLIGSIATLGILLLASISGLWFYWFQWKPNEIRKVCVEESVNKAESEASPLLESLIPDYEDEIKEKASDYYRECLVKQGMKPESLFANTVSNQSGNGNNNQEEVQRSFEDQSNQLEDIENNVLDLQDQVQSAQDQLNTDTWCYQGDRRWESPSGTCIFD